MSQTRSGYRTSVAGLVGALLVTLPLLAGVYLFTLLGRHEAPDPVTPVDYTAELATARAEAPFAVLAPESLPAGWRATSVNWDGAGPENAWHLGFLTDTDEYVGLEQGNAVAQEFVADKTPADQPGEPVRIEGTIWQTLTGNGDTALVHVEDGVTTIVTGTAPESTLVAFARSLRPS
ncbi:MAG TPA: DUF4245 domain-containing protein [Nocardioidaceae bacterium]